MQKTPIHPESDDGDSLADDQKERSYYYDDAHGYEDYDPDGEDDVKEDGEARGRDDAETWRRGDAEKE